MKLIVIRPGQDAEVVESAARVVALEVIHRLVGVQEVGVLSLGTMPSGRRCRMWNDDEALLRADSVPNRRIGPDTVIFNGMMICALEADDEVALTDEEAADVLALVEGRWAKLPADAPRPQVNYTIRSF